MSTDDVDEEARRELEEIYRRATDVDSDPKCKHMHVKKSGPLVWLEDSNIQAVELYCEDCNKFIGWAYRRKKIIDEEAKPKTKFILYKQNPNYYIDRDDANNNNVLKP